MTARDKTAATCAVLSLGFAVLYWALVMMARAGQLPFSMEHAGFALASLPGTLVWAILRGFGPALAGVIAVALWQGREGVAALGRSCLRWRVAPSLYLFAMFGAVANLAVIATGLGIGAMHFAPSMSVARVLLFFVPMLLLDGPLGEEIGWRGVLLPNLPFGAVGASLFVGVLWYLWHVPLYAADGKGLNLAAHAAFLYSCLALSILFTWFYERGGGSTFLAIWVHNCTNYFIFVRFKTFARSGDSLLPSIAYLAVLTSFAALAAHRLYSRRHA